VSVGPDASEGYGNTNVTSFAPLAPVPVSPWSGWPNGWNTPAWNDAGNGGLLGRWGQLADIVFACLDLNSSILASMPPYLLNNGDKQHGRSWLTNPEPMTYASWQAFAKELVWSFVGVGEAFLYATDRFADGYPSRFMLLSPSFVEVERAGGRIVYTVAGAPVDADDVLHIKYTSWPGDLRGHGPLEVAGARLLTVAALSRYATNLATTGGLPPAVLKYPRRANRAQIRQMQTDWVEARMSAMGVPAVLADGTELDVLNPQLADAALADLARFNESRLATLLSVPPFLVGLQSELSSTYVNSANVFDFHWRAMLRPKADALCGAMSGWLLPRGWTVELDRDDYIKPGMFERAQAYTMYIGSGVLTPEDVRTAERFDTVPGTGDENDPGNLDDNAVGEVPGAPGRPPITNTTATPEVPS
jgi:HK97 family phage portal protein